jgi:hypothetical protein
VAAQPGVVTMFAMLCAVLSREVGEIMSIMEPKDGSTTGINVPLHFRFHRAKANFLQQVLFSFLPGARAH